MYLRWFKDRNKKQIKEIYQEMKDWANDGGLMCCLFKNQYHIHEITYTRWVEDLAEAEDIWLRNYWYEVLGFFNLKKEFGLEDVKQWLDDCESGRSIEVWKNEKLKEKIRNVSSEYEV